MRLGGLRRGLSQRFRRRRMKEFVGAVGLDGNDRVLDIGGTPWNWSFLRDHPPVVMVNVAIPEWVRAMGRDPRYRWVIADGRRLPFRDGAFDVVFSNAVIEHVGTFENQARFAAEVRRVGRRYYVETPNRRFFFEPHLLTPFVHWLPRRWMGRSLRFLTVWGLLTRPSEERRGRYMEDVWLMAEPQMREVFPDGEIRRERFLGMTKSLVAVGTTTGSAPGGPGPGGGESEISTRTGPVGEEATIDLKGASR